MEYIRVYPECGEEVPDDEMVSLGLAEMCADCFTVKCRREETMSEYLQDFLSRHEKEFLWWVFQGDLPLADSEKTDWLRAGWAAWKQCHPQEAAEAEKDFTWSSPGEWEDYLKGF